MYLDPQQWTRNKYKLKSIAPKPNRPESWSGGRWSVRWSLSEVVHPLPQITRHATNSPSSSHGSLTYPAASHGQMDRSGWGSGCPPFQFPQLLLNVRLLAGYPLPGLPLRVEVGLVHLNLEQPEERVKGSMSQKFLTLIIYQLHLGSYKTLKYFFKIQSLFRKYIKIQNGKL